MDEFLIKFLLLDSAAIVAISFGLVVIGGVIGAFLFNVSWTMRRVAYLWWIAITNLALMLAQLLWALIPVAADAGLLSGLILLCLSSFIIFGMALYYGSAARSNHMDGDTSSAWMGFVPFANIYLMVKRGGDQAGTKRSAFYRYLADPVLVITALIVFALSQAIGNVLEDTPAYSAADSAALNRVISDAQTVEESLATEVKLSRPALPMRVDEITVLSGIEASGRTLLLIYDVEKEVPGFFPGFKNIIAEEQCGQEMFGPDLARGATIVSTFRSPSKRVIAEYEITQADCKA